MADRYDEELFLGYIEGELTPEQNARFEQKLLEDARLRNLVYQLLHDRIQLRKMPHEQAPAELMERVNERLERGMLLQPTSGETGGVAAVRKFRIVRWAGYSAVAALVLVTAGVVFQSLRETKLLRQSSASKSSSGQIAMSPPPAPSIPPPPGESSGESGVSKSLESSGPALALKRSDSNERQTAEVEADKSDSDQPIPGKAMASAEGTRRREMELFDKKSADRVASNAIEAPARAKADLSEKSRDALKPSGSGGTGGGDAALLNKSGDVAPRTGVASGPRGDGMAMAGAVPKDGQQRQQLNMNVQVLAANPMESQRRLVNWANNNSVRVVDSNEPPANDEAKSKLETAAAVKPAAPEPAPVVAKSAQEAVPVPGAAQANRAAQTPPPAQRMVLVLRVGQLSQLEDHLNRQRNQRVIYVEDGDQDKRMNQSLNRAKGEEQSQRKVTSLAEAVKEQMRAPAAEIEGLQTGAASQPVATQPTTQAVAALGDKSDKSAPAASPAALGTLQQAQNQHLQAEANADEEVNVSVTIVQDESAQSDAAAKEAPAEPANSAPAKARATPGE